MLSLQPRAAALSPGAALQLVLSRVLRVELSSSTVLVHNDRYDQDNYPEMLGHICIINAPGIFRMLWNVVKGMLDPRTQSKIEVRSQRLARPRHRS